MYDLACVHIRSGDIDSSELMQVMLQLHQPIPHKEAERLVKKYGVDNTIDFDAFSKMVDKEKGMYDAIQAAVRIDQMAKVSHLNTTF